MKARIIVRILEMNNIKPCKLPYMKLTEQEYSELNQDWKERYTQAVIINNNRVNKECEA